MAVSFVSQATGGRAGSTSLAAVPMAPSILAGDLLLTVVAAKPYSVVPVATTAGWSEVITGANGSTASSGDAGSVRGAAFQKLAAGSDADPSFTLTGGNTAVGKVFAFRKDASEIWDVVATQGSDNDPTGTSLSATGDTTLDIQAGDIVAWFVALPSDAPGTASRVVSVPGCTGTTTVLTNPPTTPTGDDSAALLGYFVVSTGTASGPPVFTCSTDAGQSSGLATFIRLRAVSGSASGTLDAVLPPLSASLAGTSAPPAVTGTLSASLPGLSANLVGESYPPGIAGDLIATLPPLGGSLTGAYSDAATLAAVLPPLSAAFAGTSGPPPVTGSLAATLPALRATITGQAFEPGVGGYLEALLPALSASVSADVLGRTGLGIGLDSDAVLSVVEVLEPEPSVPAGTPPTVLHVIAPTVPVPTLVAGRPQ